MKVIIIIFIYSVVFGQTQYPAINTFFSSKSLSLGGAGYLYSDILSLKSNPAVSNINRLFTTSIINYKNGISSQSIGFNFPLKKSNVSFSIKNISYGTFEKYDENKILKYNDFKQKILKPSYGKKKHYLIKII